MTGKLVELISERLNDLCWVEKNGGLVKVLTQYGEDGGMIKFPASCGASLDQCFDQGDYMSLFPNSDLKSVLFFLPHSSNGLSLTDYNHKGVYNFSINLNLFLWINLKQMGYDECDLSFEIMGDLLKVFKGGFGNDSFKGVSVSVKDFHWHDSKFWNVFDFGNEWALYPFDFFNVILEVKGTFNINCFDDLECLEPIPC